MSNEVTIDALQIEIEAESGAAASNLDKLAQSLDRLQAVTQRITTGGDGLNKVAKQIEKLNTISQKIQSMQGFEKLERAVNSLKKLNELNNVGDISGFVRNLNKLPQAMNALAQMPAVDASKFQQLADAMKPLQSVDMSGLNSMLNALRKLPKVSQELAGVDFAQFTQQIAQISQAIEPLARQAQSAGAGLTALAQVMQQTNRRARQSSDGVGLFNQAIGNIKVKTLAAIAGLRRLYSALKSGVTASAAYVENLNLFNVTMGASAGEAMKFAEAVNAALGVDTSDWIRYQGVFQSIGKGFGIVSQKADVMSKNLTQLTYDISSFYNISADTAAEKLQSALSGQAMPMRQLGFAIEETTLKQVALNHSIETSVENMTQAQKAQLRYIAIMEQAGNIGVLGDMARTIDTASNGLRVLQARMQQFSRAVGNMVMPVLSAVLPYLTAFVQLLTEGAQKIANFFGFELPKIDFSGASVSSGFDDIAGAADEATRASKEFKGTLAGIDQLNIIGSKDEGKSSDAGQFDLGIELPEYDFLQGLESKTKQIVDDIKAIMPWLEAFAAAVASAFAVKNIGNFITGLSNVKNAFSNLLGDKAKSAAKVISGIAGGLAAGASSGILFYNSIKNLITGTGKLGNNIAMLAGGIGIAGGAIAAFIKLKNPVGAVITGIGALAGVFIGIAQAQKELNNQIAESVIYADNGGISIRGLTDGFKGYFDSITSGYDDILANTAAFKDNEEKINGAVSEVDNIVSKYTALNQTITVDDAGKIATAIQTIGDGIKTNLGEGTRGIINQLKDTFNDFAVGLGKDVDGMVTKFYLLESMGNTALATTRQKADELAASLQSGNLTVEQQQKTFEDLQTTIKAMGTSDVGTKEQMSFERALQEMSTSKINFDDPDTLKSQITELQAKADQAKSSIMTAYEDQTWQLAQMKQRYETMTDLETGKTIKQMFNEQMKDDGAFDRLFADTQAVYDKAKETNLAKIDIGQATYLAMLQNQLDTSAADDYVWELTKFIAEKEGLSREEAISKLKGSNEIFGGVSLYDEAIAQYKETDTAKEIQEMIDTGLKGLNTEGALEAGKMITEGLANGTISGQPDFNKALDIVAIDGLDALRNAFLIASPSKKTEEMGLFIMQGLSNGIMGGLPEVLKTLDTVSAAMFDTMSGVSINMDEVYERVKKGYASFDSSYKLPAGAVAVGGAVGAAREAYASAAQNAATSNGEAVSDININLQSYVELDGEQVGYAVSQFQQRQTAYSNGI